jgi:uncharacterized cupredoxin-like copper-binding protein
MRAVRAAFILRPMALIGVLAVATACSSGTPTASSSASATAAPSAAASAAQSGAASGGVTAPSASVSASGSASAGTLALTATEYAFAGPTSVPAGVTTISLQNAGKEEHQAQLVQINAGKTFADLQTALQAPDPAAALGILTLAGGPNGVQPGQTGTASADLKPGNYAFLCFISGPDGLPHVAKGMVAQLEVTGTSAGGSLPTTDATITAKDFGFDVPASVAAGTTTFTLKNDGPQPHEAALIKLNSGFTVDQVLKMLTSAPPQGGQSSGAPASGLPSVAPSSAGQESGAPPWTDVGGIGGISPGTSATFTANLEAGSTYAFICFIPDPATGKPHAQLGMIAPIPAQ